MVEITSQNAAKQAFMPLMRELVRAYQSFSHYSADGFRLSGSNLTQPQGDVVFTLGNTEGMTFREIGEKTLITKGTLTGVIDRLEDKKMVKRRTDKNDRRRIIVRLTRRGERLFEKEFPRQVIWMKEKFGKLSKKDRDEAIRLLAKIREAFEAE